MPTIRDAKMLGGIGAILLFIPFVSIVGYILILVAMKYMSDVTRDRSIWDNSLYAVILVIVGAVVGLMFIFLPLIGLGIFDIGVSPLDPFAYYASAVVLIGLAVTWVFSLIGAIFWRRALDSSAAHTQVTLFGTAGLLYLLGAVLVIVIVGIFLVFVANILLVVAFFTLPDELPGSPGMEMAPPPA